MFKNVLIIDDDELFCESLKDSFIDEGINAHVLHEINTETISSVGHTSFDLILIDLRLKHILGTTHIKEVKQNWSESKIVIMTGFGTISTAVDAIKKGADEYITKPVTYQKIRDLFSGQAVDENLEQKVTSLDRIEREYIEYVLSKENGNISKAAKKLGLHRQSLQRKLKKWVPFK